MVQTAEADVVSPSVSAEDPDCFIGRSISHLISQKHAIVEFCRIFKKVMEQWERK